MLLFGGAGLKIATGFSFLRGGRGRPGTLSHSLDVDRQARFAATDLPREVISKGLRTGLWGSPIQARAPRTTYATAPDEIVSAGKGLEVSVPVLSRDQMRSRLRRSLARSSSS